MRIRNECTEPGMYLIQCTQTQGGIPTTPRSALGSWLIVPKGVALEDVSPILALSRRNGPGHRGGVRATASGEAPPMKYDDRRKEHSYPESEHLGEDLSPARGIRLPKEQDASTRDRMEYGIWARGE